jgi:tetratricopeptide (TPR) repeat protein
MAHSVLFFFSAQAAVSKQPREAIQALPRLEREERLLSLLDREPYLLVLDGLERILQAYARMDAAHLADEDLDRQTANFVAGALGLPASAAQSFIGEHRLRKTTNPSIGAFLRKLVVLRASRILISTRLFPADLQTDAGFERAVQVSRQQQKEDGECWGLASLGLTLAARNQRHTSEKIFKRALALEKEGLGDANFIYDSHAMFAIWLNQFAHAHELALKAKAFYSGMDGGRNHYKRRFIRSLWLQGLAAMNLNKLSEAEECFHQALVEARERNQIGEEIPTRIRLAELRRRQGNAQAARELLEEVWEPAERGGFRLYLADAWNVLAQIESDAGHAKETIDAATRAYRLAWCDGPPFAYHWGLEKARAFLHKLRAPEPTLPRFDMEGREPMLDVEIEPA